MPITSVDLDRELVKEVQRITGASTQRAAITAALENVTRQARQKHSIEALLALPVDHDVHTITYDL